MCVAGPWVCAITVMLSSSCTACVRGALLAAKPVIRNTFIHYSFKKPLWSTTLMLHQGVNLIGQRWLVHNPFHICTGLYWIGWLSLHYSNLKCVDQRGWAFKPTEPLKGASPVFIKPELSDVIIAAMTLQFLTNQFSLWSTLNHTCLT